MKIAHIINSLSTGGAEKLILDSIPIYEKKGMEVDLILLDDNASPFRERFQNAYHKNIIGLSKSSIYNPLLIFKLIPLINRYSIIHGHLFPVLYWLVFAKVFSRSRTKIVYTEHSTNNKRRNHPILKFIDRYVYSKVDVIGCISEGTKKELDKHINMPSKTVVINNGIDLSLFSSKNFRNSLLKSSVLAKDSIQLIQVASFRFPKDQATVIEAMKLLPAYYKLSFVGDGPLRNDIEEKVYSNGLENRVTFLGNRYDMPTILSNIDIVLVSSKYEGFALTAVEGMAMGKPIVASNVIGVSEVVDGAGLLFERGNAKDLVTKIMLLENEVFFKEVCEKCLNRSREYSIEKMVDKYFELYISSIRMVNLDKNAV